jgi:glycosyltransferase involved in cell wall biosynthesis
MAFGLACVGSDRGLIPQMLGEGRGVVVPPGDVGALAEALGRLAAMPDEREAMRARAADWARRYTLEGLREAIGQLLEARWGVPVGPAPRPTSP